MPHVFSREEKIATLREWADKLQGRLDIVVDAIREADILERWSGVSDKSKDDAVEAACDYVVELANDLDKLSGCLARFHVSSARFKEALSLVNEKTDVVFYNDTTFSVNLWAVNRATYALRQAGIRFTTEPSK